MKIDKPTFIIDFEKDAPDDLKETEGLLRVKEVLKNIQTETFDTNLFSMWWKTAKGINVNSHFKENNSHPANLKFTESDILHSNYLVKKIIPWVEEKRENIFASKKAPFAHVNNWKEQLRLMANFIKQESEKSRNEFYKKNPSYVEKHSFTKLNELLKLINESGFKGKFTPEMPGRSIEYSDPKLSGSSITSLVWEGSILYNLAGELEEVSKATGFKKTAIIFYIFTDLQPIISKASLGWNINSYNLPTGENIVRTKINIEISTNDLTFDELKQLYNTYRASLNVTKKKGLSEKEKEIYIMVSNEGGVRQSKPTEFWKGIKDEYNSRHPTEKPLEFWQGIMNTYKRAKDKIEQENHL
jgi:hypothetical protein